MWKRILKKKLTKWLSSDAFEDLLITTIKAALPDPDVDFTDQEKRNILSKFTKATIALFL